MNFLKLPLVVSLLIGGLVGSAVALRFFPVASEADDIYAQGDVISREAAVGSLEMLSSGIEETEAAVDGIGTLDERYVIASSHRSKRRRAWELERLFEGMSAEEASAIFIKIMDTPEYSKPGSLIAPFFRAWGGVDGASALAAAKELEGNAAKDAFKHLFPSWAKSDVHAAWEAAQANQSLPRSNDWFMPVLREFAKQDPEGVLRRMNEEAVGEKDVSLGGALVEAAVETGAFSVLMDRLARVDRPELRDLLKQNALRAWAINAPEGALDYLETIKDPEEADRAMGNYLEGWAVSDRAATLDYVFGNRGAVAVESSMGRVVEVALARGTKDENLELIKRLSDAGLIDKIGPIAVRALEMGQPDLATRLDDSLRKGETGEGPEGLVSRRASMGPMASWVRSDFEGAYSYYQEVESVELRLKHLPNLVNGIYGRSDGGTLAVSLVESVPEGKEQSALVEQMLLRAASMGKRASSDFLVGLEIITESKTGLSDKAEAARQRLFGPRK